MPLRADFTERYGRWAIVTGAAQGIGAAYCTRLAEIGMPVVMVDVQAERLEETADTIRRASPGVELRTAATDLSDVAEITAMLDSVADLEIGLLVANAGIGAVGRWLDVPVETKLEQVAVNCSSLVLLADRLTRPMVERGRGGVIVMASGAADGGSSFIVTYAATKAFDRVFAEGLWLELSPHGIDVTAVMPGSVRTPGFEESLPPGLAPTKAMEPMEPRVVVDAALAGLGDKINVRPAARHTALSVVVGSLLPLVPRRARLKLGDKAVRALYDRTAANP